MKVTLEWSEQVTYVSEVEVDEGEIRLWLADEDPERVNPQHEVTAENVREFLTAGDESDWFELCDTDTDFHSVEERTLDGVALTK